MSPQEKQQLKALLVATSLYYGQEIADAAVVLFVEDLEDLAFLEVVGALKEIRRDPRVNRLPLPAVIRARLQPPETDEDEGRQAASRIVSAIARFGWPNPERAKEYVGGLGWAVVEMQGGWTTVCQLLTTDNASIYQAQWRELAAVIRRRALAGTLDQAPQLPGPRTGGLRHLNFLEEK